MDFLRGIRARAKRNVPPAIVEALKDPVSAIGKLKFRVVRSHRFGRAGIARHIAAILRQRDIDCVVDVGANRGQYGQFLREEVGFRGPIHSFEPVPKTFRELADRTRWDGDWHAHQVALGRAPGVLPINVMASSVFSSFRNPSGTDIFKGMNEVVERVEVPVTRFDDLVSDTLSRHRRIFLKLDTQGFDLEVLGGVDTASDRIQGVQTELSLVPIYEGMPGYDAVLEEMTRRGFVLSGLYPVSMSKLQAIEFDGLLVRREPMGAGTTILYEDVIRDA